MSTSEAIRPETPAPKTDRHSPSVLVPDDHPAIQSGYTAKEVEEAMLAQEKAERLSKKIMRNIYNLAAAVIECRDHLDLLAPSKKYFNYWAKSLFCKPIILTRCMKMYEGMTIRNDIPLNAYVSLDLAKLDGFVEIIDTDANKEQLKQALEIAREKFDAEWKEWAMKAAANLKAGRNMGDPTPLPAPDAGGDE